MNYIDGCIIPVKHANKDAYFAMASKMKDLFLKYGALRVVETWQDNVPHGKVSDLYRAVAATEDEGLVFSWIEWPNKEVRDIGFEKVFADEGMQMNGDSQPFDGKRMIFGSFNIMIDGS